ncbi:putative ATP-dependent RNA helicase DHR1 [Coemansia sp. RSA 1722]|nr:putative ATP-dependent RNA helicase DHR1 [Coemansia sp. RSA 1722]KAJ2638580.1 putative ATP-dependent RNA helicase DHR1 [Coemansia sp. RSA 1286]
MGTNKSRKEKRFEKFVEKQVKKEQRAVLIEKLSKSTWKNDLMKSSKTLGRKTETKKERLMRAAMEEKLGMTRTDTDVRLFVSERDADEVGMDGESFLNRNVTDAPAQSAGKRKRNKKNKKNSESLEDTGLDKQPNQDVDMGIDGTKDEDGHIETMAVDFEQREPVTAESLKRSLDQIVAGSALASTTIVKRKRQKKGRVLEKLGLIERHEDSSDEQEQEEGSDSSDFDSSASEAEASEDEASDDEGQSADEDSGLQEQQHKQGHVSDTGSESESESDLVPASAEPEPEPEPETETKPPAASADSQQKPLRGKRMLNSTLKPSDKTNAYYVSVERPDDIQQQRILLPVYAEEQQIMEAITDNPVVVLSGETGSGKTTQVPQFLFEAGYGDPASSNPGMIGITQPRRVAALSMSHRVSQELGNFGHTVAHQVRFDTSVSDKTRVKFMTEGVLLRELATDLLLTKYSVIIIDEAHERSLNTDILLGVLSRVVRLRHKLSSESPAKHRPLKLVIMSATLRVDDFVKNTRLFKDPPPVINVQARQHAVRVHFNRRTPAPGQHLGEVIKKVGKIHQRLPAGGILVFLTGQAEITYVCKKLREEFPTKEEREQRKKEALSKRKPSTGDKRKAAVKQSLSKKSAEDAMSSNAHKASVEDEDVDLGNHDMFTADGELRDDFEMDSESDSEEEDEIIIGGEDEAERRLLLSENINGPATKASDSGAASSNDDEHPDPLYVLPLYSLLPAEQQLKVFAPPPPGMRLCVVATNVAETSITIPGIRYVVDTGLAKEKTYDAQTQVQSFEVGWTSQASSNQRMGRAGRTGPGHCYRIFSSAVFNDQFAKFSEPEIMRMPIEGVVLQMKAMNLDNVVNFPFPTPPSRSALTKAERLLTWLGALDDKGHVNDLGRLMSVFPVAPRFAKMLIIGQQHGCLPYIIGIVAALSVGDPFIKEFNLDPDSVSDFDLSKLGFDEQVLASEASNMTNEEMAAKEQQRLGRRKYWNTQAKLAGTNPASDVLKWLTVVGAFEYAGGTDAASKEYYVRTKAMGEIRKLRGQLTNLVQMYCPGVDVAMDPRMAPPSKLQQSVIRQIVLAGFMDQVAVRGDVAGYHDPDEETNAKRRGMHAVPYVTMWSSEPVYIHPESVAYIAARNSGSMPQAIVYTELQRTTRLWAKVVTIVNTNWLATIGQPLCTFSNPLPYPLPKYNDSRDHMVCYVEPRFGPRTWLLPMVKVEETRTGTRWQISKVIG